MPIDITLQVFDHLWCGVRAGVIYYDYLVTVRRITYSRCTANRTHHASCSIMSGNDNRNVHCGLPPYLALTFSRLAGWPTEMNRSLLDPERRTGSASTRAQIVSK